MRNKAVAWGENMGLLYKDAEFLGSGDYGEAYAISKELVIKITMDEAEYELAAELLDGDIESVVSIYAVTDFGDGYFGILQERLSMDPKIENLYGELMQEAEAQDVTIPDIETDNLTTSPSWRALTLLEAIQQARDEILHLHGLPPEDIHYTNIGVRDEDDAFVLFDLRKYSEAA